MFARAREKSRLRPLWRPVCALLVLLLGVAGCDEDQLPLPYIRVSSLPAYSRITTNNGLNQAITIQGTIGNLPPNRQASIQVVNDLGAFPTAAPAMPLTVSSAGAFSFQIQAPLVNPSMPMLPGSAGNAVIIRAVNDFSPIDFSGNPIPSVAAFSLVIDNQVVFTHPAYADLDGGMPPAVVNECDFTTVGSISGTFSVPVGTLDASTVITSAELIQRTDANALLDLLDDGFDETSAAITVETDGTFEQPVTSTGSCAMGDTADCNFFIRFITTSQSARTLLGSTAASVTMSTYPFQGCMVLDP